MTAREAFEDWRVVPEVSEGEYHFAMLFSANDVDLSVGFYAGRHSADDLVRRMMEHIKMARFDEVTVRDVMLIYAEAKAFLEDK